MKTEEKNNSLVEFELPNSEMGNVTGGAKWGNSGGHLYGNCWCSGDWGNIERQTIYVHTGCESAETGGPMGYADC